MNLLFGFTADAFHSHYEVTFFWQHRVSVSHNTAHRSAALSKTNDSKKGTIPCESRFLLRAGKMLSLPKADFGLFE